MTNEELLASMTEEIPVDAPGTEEMAAAVHELQRSWRDFCEFNKGKGPIAAHDYEWWKRAEYLMLADSTLKQLFCGRDLRPASVRLYHQWRLHLCCGQPFRRDA